MTLEQACNTGKAVLLVDASMGIYIGQEFCSRHPSWADCCDEEDWRICEQEGPYNDEYWECWERIVEQAVKWTKGTDGKLTTWTLCEDQDLWAIADDVELDD